MHQWLEPKILVSQEAEIRRMVFKASLGKIVHETLFQEKKKSQKGLAE
jgi:hypothetical protein